jgi:tRNA(Ile)-lysidine synthase
MRRPPAVARVLERVTRTAREHEMFAPGQTVLVACSGGPDSVCALLALHHLGRLLQVRLQVFHFDHRLRPGSAAEAEYVRRLSKRLGLPFHVRAAQEGPPRGASVELWARGVRTRAAREVMLETGAERLALGHTQDDQAETVLLGLVLGWGPEAIGGMSPVSGSDVRPLLDVTREEVEAFCRSVGLRPRRDPTNSDTRFLRNALRLRAIPALERVTGRNVRATIAQTAELLRVDQEALRSQAIAVAGRLVEPTLHGCRIRAAGLGTLPRAISSRVVRHALGSVGAKWTLADIEGVLGLASGRPGRRLDLSSGLNARRDREYVSLSRASPESRG